jgi:hypothetical protein
LGDRHQLILQEQGISTRMIAGPGAGTQRNWRRLLPWITAFAVAMGFLESAVVVYLRALYYPDGFAFPLVPMEPRLVLTELLREAATLVMLVAPGALLTPRRMERFAWFCWSFAVWDLFYYVFLKLLLGWPGSLLTWDVLFLLPTIWVGPVLAPCMVSIGMLMLAVLILRGREVNAGYGPGRWQWVVLWSSAAIMLYTFMAGPVHYLISLAPERTVGANAMSAMGDYLPAHFPWTLFLLACGMAFAVLVSMYRDIRRAAQASR